MDILKPDLMWIEGRCYRIPVSKVPIHNETESREMGDDYDYEDTPCEYDDPCNDFEIETMDNGHYRTAFHVPRSYFSYIIGAKGSTKRRVEDETRTQICVPKQGQDGDIVITGNDDRGVSSARQRINLIVTSFRLKQKFSHFFSIPMTGKEILKKFISFKEEVCKMCTNHRIDESVFQKPEKLHLTLGTMVLADSQECALVSHMLCNFNETVVPSILKNQQLKLCMTGIEYMNDDPSEVDILYGKVQVASASGNDTLQLLADNLVDFFSKTGFMEKQYERVKLHVTLMNTLFREDQGGASIAKRCDRRKKPRETFDATAILKEFEDYTFGELIIDGIHLSIRHTTAANGYYKVSTEMKFK